MHLNAWGVAPTTMRTLADDACRMARTGAHAGSGSSFEINGQKIHLEAPRNCDAVTCIKITAPGLNLKGFNHPVLAAEILSWREEVDNVVDAASATKRKKKN